MDTADIIAPCMDVLVPFGTRSLAVGLNFSAGHAVYLTVYTSPDSPARDDSIVGLACHLIPSLYVS
jgi:hypothetical protein